MQSVPNPQSLFINLEGMAKLSDHSVSGLNRGEYLSPQILEVLPRDGNCV